MKGRFAGAMRGAAAALFAAAVPGACAAAAPAAAGGLPVPQGAAPALPLAPCRLDGIAQAALCGALRRPLDPAAPAGTMIDVHVAVLPAAVRNKHPDPVFFFAGGPGQSAIDVAGVVAQLLARLGARRDIVLIDQRGTGRSAPLYCDDARAAETSLRDLADPAWQLAMLERCRQRLQQLPHGDLRRYTTTIAMHDADAVRAALGAARVNLVGMSYGTRAALEYMRLFPHAVRRVVLDGVVPPDAALARSFAVDAGTAFDALLAWCAGDAGCRERHPRLHERWRSLLAGLPRETTLPHPLTDADERLTLTRDMVVMMVRQVLYSPLLASALPLAIDEAAGGRFGALAGLTRAVGGGAAPRRPPLAHGMHFAVLCAEDAAAPASPPADAAGDFAAPYGALYARVCADWPRGEVPAGFHTLPQAPAATLLLSGGIDPVTPPRHGQHVAQALGPRARHAVVANAGHGVLALPCLRDAVFRFVDAADAAVALAVDTGCAAGVPRPPAWARPGAAR